MITELKGILKNATLPRWEDADEIIRHVWLGIITDNEDARMRKITKVICISRAPQADLQREGFKNALDLDSTPFILESDTKGDLVPIFGKVCDAIDKNLREDEGVLVWDVGGGVAVLAAYIMRRYDVCLPEAMAVITRTRLGWPKPKPLPRQRIIDLLHNEIYLKQLEKWQACKYDFNENTITNPDETREKWIIESVREDLKGEGKEDLQATPRKTTEKLPRISKLPHRLSTIAQVEEEIRHLSTLEPNAYWRPGP